MIHEPSEADWEPSPEQLAAFADGELEAPCRDRVEAWLSRHPQRTAEVETLRRLMQLYHKTTPTDPSPRAWATTLAKVEAALPGAVARPAPRTSYRWVAGLGIAAAVLGAVLLTRALRPPATEEPPDDQTDEPFPVAMAHEINIIQMDATDADALAVGPPRFLGPFDFAKHADITLVKVEPSEPDGPLPWLEPGEVPMIIDPGARPGGREP
jgi:hypothetical protein